MASGVVGAEGWLERAVETFAAAVGRGLADEREAGREAGEAALARAGVGAVAPAVSVAQFTAAGRADGPGPKACVIARATCLSFAKRSPRWPTGWPRPSALPARWSRTATAGRRRGSALSRHRCPAHRGRGGDDAAIVRLGWRGCHAVRRGQGGAPRPQEAVYRAAVTPDRPRRGSATPAPERAAPRSRRSAGRGVGPGGGAAERRERLATQRARDDVGRAFRAPVSRGIFGASWAGRFVCRGSVVGLVGLGVCGPVSKKSGDELRRRSPSGNRRAAPPNGPSFPSVNPAAARGPDPLEFVKRIVAWGGFGRSTACLGPGFWDSAPIPPPETAPLAELSGPIPDLFGETTYAQSRRR